jgi:hypothetical protein
LGVYDSRGQNEVDPFILLRFRAMANDPARECASATGATVVTFRTLQEAQRARYRWNKTWAYNAWEVLIMMPLKTWCARTRTGIWLLNVLASAPRHELSFQVNVCEVDPTCCV